MSYQVIARKYRPQRFSDVVGQDHVTRTLANAIQQNRIAHAYLFVGPRGTGKTTIARIFAKCLNCTDGPRVDYPDEDPRCVEIAEGRSLDVLEIDGASNRGIEEIRELRETVKYAPATSKFKIYIIDEVHMLTKEAFNALLKTLEEPPAHVKFMFATTEPEKVLATILSRCQRFDLRRIPVPLIAQHLAHIARQELVQIEEPALHAIARGAEGGMRDAESALDQLISFCGNTIVEADVLSMFGLTARGQILALARGILAGEVQTVLEELNHLAKQGKDLSRLLSDLLSHFRNLLIFQVAQGDLSLLEVGEAEVEALQEQASLTDADTLTRLMEILTMAEGRFRDAASKKIFLEVTLLQAIQARQLVPIGAVLEHLQSLKGGGTPPSLPRPQTAAPRPATAQAATRPSAPAARRTTRSAPAPEPAQPPPSPAPATAQPTNNLQFLWAQIVDAVGRASPFTRTYLLEAHPVSFARQVLTIGFDPEFSDQLELVNNQRTATLLQTKLKELGHPGAQIRFVQDERPADWSAPAMPEPESGPPEAAEHAESPSRLPAPPAAPAALQETAATPPKAEKLNIEEFKNDPLIKQALDIFKGQIVEVRG